MIYVVLKMTGTIMNRCDAWEDGGMDRMMAEARDAGLAVLGNEITMNGDMVIWVDWN